MSYSGTYRLIKELGSARQETKVATDILEDVSQPSWYQKNVTHRTPNGELLVNDDTTYTYSNSLTKNVPINKDSYIISFIYPTGCKY